MFDWKALSNEYRQGRKQLNKLHASMDKENPERKIITGMIRDTNFVIEWLETGWMPGKMKGIDRKDAYEISLGKTYKKTAYGVNGYWDESLGGFASMRNYENPYLEVEEKIDGELEEKRNDSP